jgi:translation initiation factor 2 beta subunit (eIF-2beta)/eIF-5
MPVSRKYSRNSFKKSTQKKSKYSRNKKVSANSRKARLVGGRRVKGKRVKGKKNKSRKTRKHIGGMNVNASMLRHSDVLIEEAIHQINEKIRKFEIDVFSELNTTLKIEWVKIHQNWTRFKLPEVYIEEIKERINRDPERLLREFLESCEKYKSDYEPGQADFLVNELMTFQKIDSTTRAVVGRQISLGQLVTDIDVSNTGSLSTRCFLIDGLNFLEGGSLRPSSKVIKKECVRKLSSRVLENNSNIIIVIRSDCDVPCLNRIVAALLNHIVSFRININLYYTRSNNYTRSNRGAITFPSGSDDILLIYIQQYLRRSFYKSQQKIFCVSQDEYDWCITKRFPKTHPHPSRGIGPASSGPIRRSRQDGSRVSPNSRGQAPAAAASLAPVAAEDAAAAAAQPPAAAAQPPLPPLPPLAPAPQPAGFLLNSNPYPSTGSADIQIISDDEGDG